ncbi:uncharacterized protein LOC105160785 [Sesamum indicum]|uniref:Uncharacterized protein LOC105160785 n=1 Tax=Sesamum indicum TaxID=4182 RepID=A0A6I9T7T5_SESIN|nr:uncharacterized protein LOC105160785 [Sesamum indicum]
MAVDICSESSSPVDSPRLSFSDDITEIDLLHYARSNALLPNSTVDFNFCLSQGLSEKISPADELFANGRILPVEIKKITPQKETHQPDPILGHCEARQAATKTQGNVNDNTMKKRLIEFLSYNSDGDEEDKPLPRPFWQFRRSSSLNCDTGRTNGLLRSLQFLTRSNSTSSAPNQNPKVIQKQHLLKESATYGSNSKVRANSQYCSHNNTWKKPSLRKSNSSLHGMNGVGISPILNIPPTYISKGTITLFGFGSFLCNKGSKKKKKKK